MLSGHRFGTSDHQRPPHHKQALEERKQWGAILTQAFGVASRLVTEGAGDVLSRVVQPFGLLAILNMQ